MFLSSAVYIFQRLHIFNQIFTLYSNLHTSNMAPMFLKTGIQNVLLAVIIQLNHGEIVICYIIHEFIDKIYNVIVTLLLQHKGFMLTLSGFYLLCIDAIYDYSRFLFGYSELFIFIVTE